ncbi:Necrosis inducing-like protein NPP1 type [Phytophthora palmivora]|uniref:Necrosis inducing-like protein NPP1 type n=1 Tax=Phytophthora palmivora TaxID=4796 RepID=A0A2P4XE57_9STRA|nr:Necrosis inducing-like protein NPP1 type [Phytophthora palmivora]
MNLRYLLISVVVAAITVQGVKVNHDTVQPFREPEPATISEKAAVKFKPQLHIDSGCHPYPAVNAEGDTSAGLKGSGPPDGECKGSGLGSQIYGRSQWYGDLWAIMYAWYFPKDKQRHEWMNVVVWLDNPAHEEPKVLSVAPACFGDGYFPYTPLASTGFNGTHPLIAYIKLAKINDGSHTVDTTYTIGEFQDLIMWEQLTEKARAALQERNFEEAKVPFTDANFEINLKSAWPYTS